MDLDRREFLKATAAVPVAGCLCAVPVRSEAAGLSASDGGAFDVVVIGGSTTGVFAAVRAAEAGMRVALVENNALLGGTATAGFVPVWHSMFSMNRRRIVGGLTEKLVARLVRRGAAVTRRPGDPGERSKKGKKGSELIDIVALT